MSEKQNITLTLDAHRVALAIDREQEPVYREAAQRVNDIYHKYTRAFPTLPVEKIWVYTALELAVNFQSDARDKRLQPVMDKLQELSQLINSTLNLNIDNPTL